MSAKIIISFLLTSIAFISISTAQNSTLLYGYVEKMSGDEMTTHYAHIVLKQDQLIMNRIVIYADSTTKEQGRQEVNETYKLTEKEINQLEKQLTAVLVDSKMPELTKVRKEDILLDQNIEKWVTLNSKRNLIVVGGNNYYIEYNTKLGDERAKMSDIEFEEFTKLERMIKKLAKPIQQIYRQKHGEYRQLFGSL